MCAAATSRSRRATPHRTYFRGNGRFSDFLVHEAAHIFHNCKRRTVGLPETRTREWLLDIEFRKRETFAYACEAYSCIVDLARTPATRMSLVEDLARGPLPSDERVDPMEYLDIVREAAGMRNGWKRILSRCAPRRRCADSAKSEGPCGVPRGTVRVVKAGGVGPRLRDPPG